MGPRRPGWISRLSPHGLIRKRQAEKKTRRPLNLQRAGACEHLQGLVQKRTLLSNLNTPCLRLDSCRAEVSFARLLFFALDTRIPASDQHVLCLLTATLHRGWRSNFPRPPGLVDFAVFTRVVRSLLVRTGLLLLEVHSLKVLWSKPPICEKHLSLLHTYPVTLFSANMVCVGFPGGL